MPQNPSSTLEQSNVVVRLQTGISGNHALYFRHLKKKAAQNGIPVSSQTGEAVKDGITIGWKYDPDAELLEVGCVRAPFWIDAACVNRKLSDAIESSLDSHRAA